MADTRYLKLRRQTWYFRLKVPTDLTGKAGAGGEVVESLDTRDLSVVQVRRWERVAHWTQEFEVLRGSAEAERMVAREVYHRTLQQAREGTWGTVKSEAEGSHADIGLAIDQLREEAERKVGEHIEDPDELPPVTKARLDALQDYLREAFGKRVRPRTAYAMPFSECAERYLKEVDDELTRQTVGQYQAVFRLFEQFINDKPMRDVTAKDAVAFLDTVSQFDPNWGKGPKAKERTLAEVKELFSGKSERLSVRTVNRYVTSLSCAWRWAKKRQEAEGDNPFEGLFKQVSSKNSSGYVPFELDELHKQFSPVPDKRALREIPFIALYSGMRLNEICSLAWENVREAEGVWHFDIVAAKSEAGVRVVPTHSKLIRLLERRSVDPKELLRPELKPGGPDNKLSWHLSKRFTTHRRGRGIDAEGKAFHSFRKNVTRCLERARVPQTEAAEIIGHEKAGITYRVYNPDGLTMEQRREVVEKITYPGLNVDF